MASSVYLLWLLLCRCLLSYGLEFDVLVSQVSCYDIGDGFAQVNITDGEPPFNYLWSSSKEDSAVVSNLVPGIYNVTVTDRKHTSTKPFIIYQPSRLQATAYSYSTLASCNKTGAVSAIAHGGMPPYKYTWQSLNDDELGFSSFSAGPAFVIYDESLSSTFMLEDGSDSVNLRSARMEAYSGIWSMRVSTDGPQKFTIMCSSATPQCIKFDQFRGLEFWMWKGDSNGKLTVGLVNSDGVIVQSGAIELGFTAKTWTMGYLNFTNVPQDFYGGIFFLTDSGLNFHLDDIALLPKEEIFASVNESACPIGTPSAIYGPEGDYSLQVFDSNLCPVALTMTISGASKMQSIAVVDGHTVTISTQGGTAPYVYVLGNSTTNANGIFYDVLPGNHTLSIADSSGCRESMVVLIIPPPTPTPIPTSSPSLGVTFLRYTAINSLLGVLAAICTILAILCSVLVHKRKHDLRPHSLLFCQTILIGAILGYVAAILAVIDVSWARCIAFSWTVDFSVTIIYGSMFAKSMQILKILDNITKFVSIDTTDRYMAKVFCFIIVPELVLLSVWTGLTGNVLKGKMGAGEGEVIFWIIFLVYKIIIGCLSSFVCFRMRFKFKEYTEIQQIAYCHFTMEVVLIFLLIFTLVARETYSELFVGVQSFSVSVIVSIPLLVIICPILKRAWKDYREVKRTNKWKNLTMYE